jgi:hypothetical protein
MICSRWNIVPQFTFLDGLMFHKNHFFHLFKAAFFAISLRFLADRLAALAFPPFKPPSLPRATAAGFFSGVGAACPVDCWTMLKAV